MSFSQTVTARLSATQRAALAAVKRAEGSSISELVRRALLETYHLDEIAGQMIIAGASLLGEPGGGQVGSSDALDEPTRRCPHCRALIRQRHEQQGCCPACGDILSSLAGAVEHSRPPTEEETAP